MAAVSARVEASLARWQPLIADELERWVPRRTHADETLYEPIRRYALRPGKGLRPALCLAACGALGGSTESALPTAAVLELYHNAFLVHDDVEDGSLQRRHQPSMHCVYGTPIAVNAGDAMLALALPPLLDNTRTLGVGRALRVLEVIAHMARETAEGQATELSWIRQGVASPTDEEYVAMVSRKTAEYSFATPLALGAIIAGATEAQVTALRALGRSIGVAFQIRDDILNLDPAIDRWGKEPLDDLWEGKRTLILSYAMRLTTETDRARALAILALPRPAPDERGDARATKREGDVDFLFELIKRFDSLAHASAVAERHAESARREMASCSEWLPPSPHRDFIEDIIEFVRVRDH